MYSFLTFLAFKIQRIKLGPAVTNIYTVIPAMVAVDIATDNKISRGKSILGLGARSIATENQLFHLKHPVIHLREAIEVIKLILIGKTVRYEGITIKIKNYWLQIKESIVPIDIAIGGSMTSQLAGEMADGVFINGLGAWPQYNRSENLSEIMVKTLETFAKHMIPTFR